MEMAQTSEETGGNLLSMKNRVKTGETQILRGPAEPD